MPRDVWAISNHPTIHFLYQRYSTLGRTGNYCTLLNLSKCKVINILLGLETFPVIPHNIHNEFPNIMTLKCFVSIYTLALYFIE